MTSKAPTDRLQPGEDPGSHYPGDARHWVGAYSELLRLLEEAALDLGGETELSLADLDRHRLLFQKRLAFWEGHLRQQEQPSLRRRARERRAASS